MLQPIRLYTRGEHVVSPHFVEAPTESRFRITIATDTTRSFAYVLRYDAYVEELHSVPPHEAGTLRGEERDAFDRANRSVTLLSWLDGVPRGTLRILAPLNGQLLCETGPEGFQFPGELPRATTIEPSRQVARVVDDPRLGLIRQSHLLLQAACGLSLDSGATHWAVAWKEAFFLSLTKKYLWPLRTFGEAREYHNPRGVPVWCDLEELWSFLEKNLQWPR